MTNNNPNTNGNAITALATARHGESKLQLSHLSVQELRGRLRAFYNQAVEADFITQLQLLAELKDPAAGPVFTFTDSSGPNNGAQPLMVRYDSTACTVLVKVGDKVVCQNDTPGQQMLLPDPWVMRVWELLQQVEDEQNAKAERAMLDEKQQVLRLFTDKDA